MDRQQLTALLTAGVRLDEKRHLHSIGFEGPDGWIEIAWITTMVPEEERSYFYSKVWRDFARILQAGYSTTEKV